MTRVDPPLDPPLDPLAEAKRLLPLDPAGAARLAEAAVRAGASDAAMLLLATASRRAGDTTRSLAAIAPLAARLAGAWGVQFEHGMALSAAGDTAGALAALRRARAAKPDAAAATHALWDIAALTDAPEAGLPPPAIAARSAEPVIAAACAFFRGEQAARLILAERLGFDPNDAAAACLLAEIGAAHGFEAPAVRLLEATLARAPGHHPARYRLAVALHRQGADDEARSVLSPLIDEGIDSAAMLALHGSIAMALGRAEEAAAALARAEQRAPDDAGIRLAHGHALRAIGQRDGAIAAYRAAIARRPTLGEAYWSIADLKTGSLTGDDMAAMEVLLARDDLDVPTRAHLGFALAHALEGAGRYDAAFDRYRSANRLRRELEPFDIAAHEDFVARTLALCAGGWLAAQTGTGDPADDPIFVVGMPRAGSSLVEQILASHSAVESASELPDLTVVARALAAERRYPDVLAALPPATFAAAGRDYLARARARRQTARPRFVDKFPGNVLHVPLIHLALPNARIIDVRRDPRDCCASLFAQSFARGQAYSYDLGDLGRYHAAYVRLVAGIDAALPGRVLRVRYEDLIADLEGETRRMLDHLGLAFEPACLDFHARAGAVRTASSEQVRQPLYATSIGRWRRFAGDLGPLIEALQNGGVATVSSE